MAPDNSSDLRHAPAVAPTRSHTPAGTVPVGNDEQGEAWSPADRDSRYPRPTFRDWALVAVNAVFVFGSLLILRHDPKVAIVALAFFGSCGVVAVTNITHKWRLRRFRAVRVDVVGGVPIRPARGRIVMLAAWLLILGVILLIFGDAYPALFRILAGLIALVGLALLAAAISGRIPRDFLQFDPDALTIARAGWRARIPWDHIAGLREALWQDNPMLLIWVDDLSTVAIEPEAATPKALASIASQPFGAHFAIVTTLYGFDLPVLTASIVNYVHDRSARDSLRRRSLATPA